MHPIDIYLRLWQSSMCYVICHGFLFFEWLCNISFHSISLPQHRPMTKDREREEKTSRPRSRLRLQDQDQDPVWCIHTKQKSLLRDANCSKEIIQLLLTSSPPYIIHRHPFIFTSSYSFISFIHTFSLSFHHIRSTLHNKVFTPHTRTWTLAIFTAIFKIAMPLCHFLHSDIIFHFKVPCEFQTRAWYPIVSRPLSAIDMTMIVLAKYPLLRGGHSHRQPTFIVSPPLQLSFTCNRWCPLTLDSHHSHKKQRKRDISGLRQIQASGGSIRYQYY